VIVHTGSERELRSRASMRADARGGSLPTEATPCDAAPHTRLCLGGSHEDAVLSNQLTEVVSEHELNRTVVAGLRLLRRSTEESKTSRLSTFVRGLR
jgi:hypothetical protein